MLTQFYNFALVYEESDQKLKKLLKDSKKDILINQSGELEENLENLVEAAEPKEEFTGRHCKMQLLHPTFIENDSRKGLHLFAEDLSNFTNVLETVDNYYKNEDVMVAQKVYTSEINTIGELRQHLEDAGVIILEQALQQGTIQKS